ncbi:MAG: hypothetical protein MUO67_11255, partial [Anaerolineales bacterium]|nr:hypothetical protein [Anaerolineales bacterium]
MLSKYEVINRFERDKLRIGLFGLLIVVALLLTACQSQSQPPAQAQEEKSEEEVVLEVTEVEKSMGIPSVVVEDQSIESGQVTIASVVSDGAGWLVVHTQADGKPGPILGFSPVDDGENSAVLVEIDAANATETLYAMLHTDAGEMGTFEFPDGP